MNRTLVIGDIHGNLRELKQCLKRSNFSFDKDTLIQLGDVVDRGPMSFECIEILSEIKNLISIRGNHDILLLDWLKDKKAPKYWLHQGGEESIESYNNFLKRSGNIDKCIDFLDNQLDYFIDSNNRAFVHGGFTSQKGLGYEKNNSIYYWDRTLIKEAYLNERNKKGVKNFRSLVYNEVYLGHTPTTNLLATKDEKEYHFEHQLKDKTITVPVNRCNIWNLDTGITKYEGRLTIMDIDSKEFWQSDRKRISQY